MSVRELHKIIVSYPNYGGIKDARDEGNNIIFSDSTLRNCCHPNLKKNPHDTSSCVVVNVAFVLKLHIRLIYPGVIGI